MSSNHKLPAGSGESNRFRVLKWLLAAAIVIALVVGASLALRQPKPDGTPETPRAEARFVDVTDRAGI